MMKKEKTTNICKKESISFEKNEHYGRAEIDRLRNSGIPYDELSAIEKFTFYNGLDYATQEALQAAFVRYSKMQRNILLTEEEFLEEAKAQKIPSAKEAYQILKEMADSGALDGREVYRYVDYRWCLRKPQSIIAYREAFSDRWQVNHCDRKISIEEAVVFVCCKFGFQASRIKIIGTPYYDNLDCNFIRFDCCDICWLVYNGDITRVNEDDWAKMRQNGTLSCWR